MMWPKEYIELQHIEDSLHCKICYEFMDAPVSTLCSHNYCSLCIRKYLHYKTQCPACFMETFEKDLRKNKILDEIITEFKQVKDKLKRALQIQIQFTKCDETDISNTPKLLDQTKIPLMNTENTIHNDIISNSPIFKNNNASPSSSINLQRDLLSSPSTSGRPKIPLMFTPKSRNRVNIANIVETKDVTCPVCKVLISELHINKHLDDCLKRESMKEKPQIIGSVREPLPKLVFNLMKDAMIKKKLKEFGLSTQGDRKAMETRLQRYIVLYNAECDKSSPRSISELVKQCEDEENTEKKINKTLLLNKLQVTRNSEQNVIENERKRYLEAHKDSFENLIKKIKSTDSPKKSAKRSLLNDDIGNNDVSPKSDTVAKNLNNSMTLVEQTNSTLLSSPKNLYGYIPDSDSDTSCPLQMYSSTDPQKFLNVSCKSPVNSNGQIKHETSDEENINQSMFPNCSSMKQSPEEEDRSSEEEESNDAFTYEQTRQPKVEDSFCIEPLNNDGKENIDSSTECNGKRSRRKRIRDSTQIDIKLLQSRKKKLTKLPHNYSPEVENSSKEESLNIFNDNEMESVQNVRRVRRRLSNITEDATVLRKSTRTKIKE